MRKSKHKHVYENVLIKRTQILGNKEHIIWLLGGKCIVCGKLKYKKYLFFENKTDFKLPIVEEFIK